jgi:adenine C2-methylase RlmN of 23S rRNA A2503 and tRNA A37
MQVLHSELDPSTNYISSGLLQGKIETRYVRRLDKDILYLSSQTGCDKLCKMCWLTATGQTDYVQITDRMFRKQMELGLGHIAGLKRIVFPETLHINFMARGEPLSNPVLAMNWRELMWYAEELFPFYKKFVPIISSIIPNDCVDLELFRGYQMPRLYWSAYSCNENFRRRWLPNAQPFDECLAVLKHYHHMGGEVRVHFPFIAGQNDSEKDVVELAQRLQVSQIPLKINIIRYNPPNDKSAESSQDVVDRNIHLMQKYMPYASIKIIDRVGADVYASCGQFVS